MFYTADDFLRRIEENPEEDTPRLAYADWLDEQGQPKTAEHVRSLRRPIIEITIDALQDDYDWGEVFGEKTSGNCTNDVDACPPGAEIDLTPPKRADVVEILAAANGENDGPEWVGVFRMRDGRILLASGSCDYTGWD